MENVDNLKTWMELLIGQGDVVELSDENAKLYIDKQHVFQSFQVEKLLIHVVSIQKCTIKNFEVTVKNLTQ